MKLVHRITAGAIAVIIVCAVAPPTNALPSSTGLETVRAGENGGGGTVPFVGRPGGGTPLGDHVPYSATLVRVVDIVGSGVPYVRVTVRDMQGEIVASKLCDELGLAVLVTPPDGRFTVEVLEVGVVEVPFDPGTPLLIVADL